MVHADESRSDPQAFDDALRLFGCKWAGFWAWLEAIGRNARPVPRRSRGSGREASEGDDIRYRST